MKYSRIEILSLLENLKTQYFSYITFIVREEANQDKNIYLTKHVFLLFAWQIVWFL